MPETKFKLSHLDGLIRCFEYPYRPTWEDLTYTLKQIYGIPVDKIGVSYIDDENEEITLSSNYELQNFYEYHHHSNEVIRFAVQDLRSVLTGGEGKKIITPSNSTDRIFDIDEKLKKELETIRPVVESFLRNPEPPIWVPPESATPDTQEFLSKLQIPTYPNGKPSILLHHLDKCDDERTKEVFASGSPMCVCNTSGSGKTRFIMEVLTKSWGFYFVATPDANKVGIQDLQEALDMVARYRQWVPDLRQVSAEECTVQNDINNQIASRAFRRVLAAHIVVLELFLQVAIQVDGSLQDRHKRIWLLFQLFDQLDYGGLHPILRIINKLRNASDDVLDALIDRLSDIIAKYLPCARLILGLDEAQWAAQLYPYCGMSSSNPGAFCLVICEMVKVFTKCETEGLIGTS